MTGQEMTDQATWQYVGFWKRVVASVVDSVAIACITAPILFAVYGSEYWGGDGDLIHGPVDFLVTWIFPTVAALWFWVKFGATPGKMVFAARIVDARTGGPPSTGQLIGRYFSYFISIIPFCLGLIWVAFDARKQGWHDKIAGTVVVQSTEQNVTPESFDPIRKS
jgi:uncharacterized RDD family membrane protein YckC